MRPHQTARLRTCRSACVTSKRCPSGTLSRHAYTSLGDRSARRFSPSSAVALPSSQRSLAIVTGGRLMHLQVLVHELGERDRRAPASRPEPVEHLPQCLLRLSARREPCACRKLDSVERVTSAAACPFA